MASTRNKNTPSDYGLEQSAYDQYRNWVSYPHSSYGESYSNAIPCMGITPSHMPRTAFSSNSIEIESSLWGINSTNLVEKQPDVIPELRTIPMESFFDTIPMIMPKTLIVSKTQRPFPIPE